MKIHRFLRVGVVLVVLAGCRSEAVEPPFQPRASHASYAQALRQLGVASSIMGREWLDAADRAIATPVIVGVPYEELALFPGDEPRALGYVFAAQRGHAITIEIDFEADDGAADAYFADLFRIERSRSSDDSEPFELIPVASRPSGSDRIVVEPRRDGRYLLRMQPELLRGGPARISIVARAALRFPVRDSGPGDIWSFYGDPRDGGMRLHEGIDIFAERGTALLAAGDSVVVRVGERTRGGNIVTLYDDARDLFLYYAHLERQQVREGQFVQAGQVIGTMGNTGNAIGTPPHLHIGLYQGNWSRAVDPWNYFVDPPVVEPRPPRHTERIGTWARVIEDGRLRVVVTAPRGTVDYANGSPLVAATPERDDQPLHPVALHPPTIASGEAVQIVGAEPDWLRVRTLDGREGFVPAGLVGTLQAARPLAQPMRVLHPRRRYPIAELEPGARVRTAGSSSSGTVVVLDDGRAGVLAPTAGNT